MKELPTLVDDLIRAWLNPHHQKIMQDNWLLHNLSHARRFVLDKNMSAFMADLSYASMLTTRKAGSNGLNHEAAQILLESMRRQSRLPHPITWIEFDSIAKMKRAVSEYDSRIDIESGVPDRGGWLCVQHPQLETAYMALECVSHAWDSKGKRSFMPQPNCLAYAWRTDDGPPPWSNADITAYIKEMLQVRNLNSGETYALENPEGILTGVVSYQSESVKVIKAPHLTKEFFDIYSKSRTFNPLKELAGDLRYLWAFLSTLNDLPISVTDVVGSKGFVARGRYRKFVDHKIVHLNLPEKRYKKVACQAIAITRRRGHPVRGHFRIDRHKPPSGLCDHRWGTSNERGHIICDICHGRKLWIYDHVRGDAGNLGIVTHDYAVHHEEEV